MTPDEINKDTLDLLKLLESKANDILKIVKAAQVKGRIKKPEIGTIASRVLSAANACEALDLTLKIMETFNE